MRSDKKYLEVKGLEPGSCCSLNHPQGGLNPRCAPISKPKTTF